MVSYNKFRKTILDMNFCGQQSKSYHQGPRKVPGRSREAKSKKEAGRKRDRNKEKEKPFPCYLLNSPFILCLLADC